MIDEGEQIVAVVRSDQGPHIIDVIAEIGVLSGGREDGVVETGTGHGARCHAARVGAGLKMEDAARGQGLAIDPGREGGRGKGAGQANELAPGRIDRTVVEVGVTRERRVGNQSADIARAGIIPLVGPELAAGAVVTHDRDIGAAVIEVTAGLNAEIVLAHAGAFGTAAACLDGQTFEIRPQDRVDHARHSVGAVKGRGPVEQDLYPAHAHRRDGIGVDRGHGNQVLGLGARVQDHPAAVQQHQGVAGTETTQVDRSRIPTGVIDAAHVLGLVEGDVGSLGNGAEQFIAVGRGDTVQVFRIKDRHGERVIDPRAADLRADDDDFLELGIGRGRLGRDDPGCASDDADAVRADELGFQSTAGEKLVQSRPDTHLTVYGGSIEALDEIGRSRERNPCLAGQGPDTGRQPLCGDFKSGGLLLGHGHRWQARRQGSRSHTRHRQTAQDRRTHKSAHCSLPRTFPDLDVENRRTPTSPGVRRFSSWGRGLPPGSRNPLRAQPGHRAVRRPSARCDPGPRRGAVP